MRVVVWLGLGALIAVVVATPAAGAGDGGAPVGLIQEIPLHGNPGAIAAGPDGNLWFTQNLPVRTGLAVGRITPSGKVTRFKAGLSTSTQPLRIVTGPDGNLWFTYDAGIRSAAGGGIGRVTPSGEITLFPEPPGQRGSPFEIVGGPDGNLWFNHSAIFTPTGQAIGRIRPSGEITEFSAGLREGAAVADLTPGPGGIWFADTSPNPAIGQIAPSGEITEFPGLPPDEYSLLSGPTPGPEGNLWFGANNRTPAPVERITPAGSIETFGAGLDRRVERIGPFAVGSDGNVWFGVDKRPPPGHSRSETELTAIGRVSPTGEIREFSDCLRPMPGYARPNFLTLGPDRNVWFTTWPSGEDAHANRASTPSIGRVTPSGEITELRLGLYPRSQPEGLVSAGGRLWFIDREAGAIGMVVPPRRPVNTFLPLAARTPPGMLGARLRVALPGPGKLTVRGAGVRASNRTADDCGPTSIAVVPDRNARRLLTRRGSRRVSVQITYTPRGGSPFSQRTKLTLRSALAPIHLLSRDGR
jgi:streptogramin lyase